MKTNYALFGFDYSLVESPDTERVIFKPFPNKSRLDKTDLLVIYPSISKYYTEDFTLEPGTWDLPFEWEKIDFLTIQALHGEDAPGVFSIKFESLTAPSLDIKGYLHIPFAKSINKFYLSNPTQLPLTLKIVYLRNDEASDRINSNLYYKANDLSYWHIKHNLGIEPVYTFLDTTGAPVEPEYTVELYTRNEIIFHFTEPFTGYVFFDYHKTFDYPDVATEWIVDHDLDKYPSVIVFDTLGSIVTGYTKNYNTRNQVTLTFTGPQSGQVLIY